MANVLSRKDSATAQQTVGHSRPITRTNRAYAYDLADAYNAAMTHEDKERGLTWVVWGRPGAEQIKLVTDDRFIVADLKQAKESAERNRQAFNAKINYAQ